MKYILVTCDIHVIGGMQQYIAGKVDYLEEKGWEVYILYQGEKGGNCLISRLDNYLDGGFPELFYAPCCYPKLWVNRTIKKMVKLVGANDCNEEIIIESQNSQTSPWGEILASKLKAKHFCFECVENFRSKASFFSDYLDFYKFKYERQELAGINENSLSLLFEGYPIELRKENWLFVAAVKPAVQNVPFIFKDKLKNTDWTICYIGRTEKNYFPLILSDLNKFAERYSDKTIQFLIIGNTNFTNDLIREKIKAGNVNIIKCGDMVPISRELFKYVDVVIAGSGCALAAKNEHVFTIVADSQTNLSGGLWWFDTTNILHQPDSQKQEHYDISLKKVLVDKIYRLSDWKEPREKQSTEHYDDHMAYIYKCNRKKEYYPEEKLIKGNSRIMDVIKFFVVMRFPFVATAWSVIRRLR